MMTSRMDCPQQLISAMAWRKAQILVLWPCRFRPLSWDLQRRSYLLQTADLLPQDGLWHRVDGHDLHAAL